MDTHSQAINWRNKATWKLSAFNTAGCLLGCAIGDLATILWFQFYAAETNPVFVMSLAIINGLVTSSRVGSSPPMHSHAERGNERSPME